MAEALCNHKLAKQCIIGILPTILKHWLPISTTRTCRQPVEFCKNGGHRIIQSVRVLYMLVWLCQRAKLQSHIHSTFGVKWIKMNIKYVKVATVFMWLICIGGVNCPADFLYVFCLPTMNVQQTIFKRGFLTSRYSFCLDFECTDLSSVQRPPN